MDRAEEPDGPRKRPGMFRTVELGAGGMHSLAELAGHVLTAAPFLPSVE